ncbi:MAG: family 78 glycoside hydrolase catalytic domain, partial [Clostridia bacterium]|nr:family 78 glycoside hydrolase catalytic domain [Clostridia bacterium]
SDGSEVWTESKIRYSQLFVGEVHDLGFPEGPRLPVTVLPDDPAVLSPQIGAPDKVIRRITPRLIGERDGRQIYDAGENISGIVRLTASGTPGDEITIRFSENVTADGGLDPESTGSHCVLTSGRRQLQEDRCICGPSPAPFEPRFCWHAFRYFEVEGPGEAPQVLVIHADTAVTGHFRSDHEGMNFLFSAFLRTQLNNMHGSIPSDCPHRERLGYTGDGQVAAMAAMLTLDTKEFYRKWMRDILDTQDQISGHVQHTAPFGGGGGGPVGWGGAIAVVPYRFWKRYGDTGLLEESWDGILKWTRYIGSRMEGGLIVREEEKGWCLGDWVTLEKIALPEPFVNTCLFIRYLDMLAEAAPAIGRQVDIARFRELQELCRKAVKESYFDPETGHFCGGIQGADAYSLHAGLGDGRTERLLIEKYDALGHFDTGFIGTDVLLEELFRLGAGETACKLLSSEEMGSFLYMKRHGATTLWERWDGKESHDHPMFGGCVRHLFEGFLGIRQKYGTGGYTDVTVEPRLPEGVDFMEGAFS